jgi:hypothetical protein
VDARQLLAADRLVGHVERDRALGQPVAHVPVVRDDARARRERKSRGRSCRFTAGSRYIVTTLARPRSVANRSCSRNSTRSCTPATRARSRLFLTSSGTISTPRPRAPKRFAAVMTIRPSPEPRSIT